MFFILEKDKVEFIIFSFSLRIKPADDHRRDQEEIEEAWFVLELMIAAGESDGNVYFFIQPARYVSQDTKTKSQVICVLWTLEEQI